MVKCILALVFSLGVMGCGGDNGDFEAPTCDPGQVRVAWSDDAEGGVMAAAPNHVFINAINGDNGYLQASDSDGNELLYLEFPTLVADGDSVSARGHAWTGADGTYGNCETGDFVSILRKLPDGVQFLLEDVRMDPFCESEPVGRSLVGCMTFSR